MMNRQVFGLVAAIAIPVATSSFLIQRAQSSDAMPGVPQMSGFALWLIAWLSLALVSVALGRTMKVTAVAAGSVLILGASLGAIMKAAGAPDALGATLVVTVSFVIMAAAATECHTSVSRRGFAIACAFWLFGACMLAGATWNCAKCGGASPCRIVFEETSSGTDLGRV